MSVRVTSSPSNLERAQAAWGGELPRWVRELAIACDREGQVVTSARIGIAQPQLSRILRRQRESSYADAEALVADALGLIAVAPAPAAPEPLQPSPAPATNLDKARAVWGVEPPRWIRLLADACDQSSQTIVAARLAKSSTWVSRIVNRSYAGSYSEAAEQVLARLGAETVPCPIWAAVSPIPLISCIRFRRKPLHSGPEAEWAKLCLTCPHNADLAPTTPTEIR